MNFAARARAPVRRPLRLRRATSPTRWSSSTRHAPTAPPQAAGLQPGDRIVSARRADRDHLRRAHRDHPRAAGRDGHPRHRARRRGARPGRHPRRAPTRHRPSGSASSASARPTPTTSVRRARAACSETLHRVRPDQPAARSSAWPRSSAPRASSNYVATCSPATSNADPDQRRLLARRRRREGRAPVPPRPASGGFVCLLAAINIFVGLFNLIPLLPFDGGHIAIATYEAIRSRHGQALPGRHHQVLPFSYAVLAIFAGAVRRQLLPRHRPPVARRVRAPQDPPDHGRQGAGRRRRAGQRPVDDHHQDGRRRGHAAADLRPGRRRLRHRPLHLQRSRGGRGPGPDRAPLAGAVVADIHFQYKLALAALEAGVHQLRLNPGNIRKPEHIKAVAAEARDRGISIRIGVNARLARPRARRASTAATRPRRWSSRPRRRSAYFEEVGFDLIKISVKASNPTLMIEAYRLLADVTDHPLHLGVTEAGPMPAGPGQGHRGHRHAAHGGHRRHDPLLAHRRSGRGGQGRPAAPREPRPAGAQGPRPDRLPVLRAGRDRRHRRGQRRPRPPSTA